MKANLLTNEADEFPSERRFNTHLKDVVSQKTWRKAPLERIMKHHYLHPVLDHRPSGCCRLDVDGDDDGTTRHRFTAVQISIFRCGGRLGADRIKLGTRL